AGQQEVPIAEAERTAGLVDRLEARGAQAVDRYTRDLNRQPGEEKAHPGNIAVVLARLVRAAHVDVGDVAGRDAVPLYRRLDHMGGEIVRPCVRKRASIAPYGSTKRVDYEGVRHARN